ncbi:hypothetical protein [Caulobacter sp. 17J65-9]|uniref:hypothetical protein n=1 Tax=Caulobacter sp. 17J65-9 TaxID=2709382 RepID=UPI0013C843B8|nr:hypothetical protein [Caulobacter sp. 17J65-9]NEX94200.1 hypothetical protein [Caulobacter sp. 17J65-9]
MRNRLGVAVLAAGLLAATGAQASLAPEWYLKARQEAPLHLQIRLTEVEAADGACTLSGETVGSFREAAPGRVEFTVQCLTPGVTPRPGGRAWFNPDRFAAGMVIEGFFEGADPDGTLETALDQLSVVPAARERPWCSTTEFRCDLP